MDKYTVDLDQVLNDFEYSELTDHHEARSSSLHNSSNIHNNFQNSNVKHSINNVFHSLNEYLNTDITPKCEAKALISNEENIETVEDEPITKPQQPIAIPQLQDEPISKPQQPSQPTTIPQQPSQPTAIPQPPPEPIPESESKTDEMPSIQSNLMDEPITEQDVIDEPITETDVEDVNPEESQEVVKAENVGYEWEEEESEDDGEIVTEETIREKTELLKANMQELRENLNCFNNFQDALEEICDTAENKVGFDPDAEIDESELSKYLEDLEKEYESSEQKICEKIEDPKQETCDDSNSNSSARPNNLPLANNQEGDDSKNVIDLIGDPGSTPYNNVYVTKEIPTPKEKGAETSDTEGSTSASPTFSDVSTETTSSCTPSTDTVNDDTGDVAQAQTTVPPGEGEIQENHENKDENGDKDKTTAPSGDVVNVEVAVTLAEEATNQNADHDDSNSWLGTQAPLWIPDADALNCMHCDQKFTVIKRRHHCRACGLVLCSKCCNLRFRLDYLDEVARVCTKCFDILSSTPSYVSAIGPPLASSSGSESSSPSRFPHPNPNNPLEYCSTVPPHQQVDPNSANPPSVMVPVGVLKRKGSNKGRSNKSVMFCDGIRPGSDLTNLDNDFSYKEKNEGSKKVVEEGVPKVPNINYPPIDPETGCFLPGGEGLPPTVVFDKGDMSFSDCTNGAPLVETLRNDALIFALNLNLFIHVKIVNMDCCINKIAWCFSTEGLINVGQDEIVILLELLDDENSLPRDVFVHLNNIYKDAVKGTSVKEMGISLHNATNFLGSKNHAGFVFIRPTFQCLQNVIKPKEPYLIGILIHKWETPWAKLFPLRLILRLGAEYRYYPSPIISNRYRDSVFVEIGHTIINLLADFRNFSYTLPQIRGLTIHMEDKNTTVTIPSNRYDQILKSMNNSSDHILAFAGNFSSDADSHLVCIQDTQSNENGYSTHAINIHNKPRKVTGASFIVFNGALKSSTGLTAKSSIVEDGLMIQIPPDHMVQVRESLRNMKNHTIQCGCINAASDETVNIIWGEPDVNFNINVFSPIDNKPMAGIPSIRVHNGKDYASGVRLIRWTEVFIIQNEGEAPRNQDPIDISKVSETIAKAACTALVKYLDLLISNSFYKIAIRANLNSVFVSYSAGSNGVKLPPIYMESLDNELVPVLHRNVTNDCDENTIILELIFRILQK